MIVRDDELRDVLAHLGRQSAPLEACGVAVPLAGGSWAVVDFINHSPEPERSWRAPGKEVAEALRIACAEGSFFGAPPLQEEPPVVWHTHPRGNVGPSEEDMDKRVSGLRHAVLSMSTCEDGSSTSQNLLTYY